LVVDEIGYLPITHTFVAGQQRTVAHSSDKARHLLGYTAR